MAIRIVVVKCLKISGHISREHKPHYKLAIEIADIQQLLQVKTRFEAAATVLFRVSDEYIPEYIDSMRKCWSGSQRLVLIKQEVPLPKPYPMNHIYYYKGLEG